MVTYKFSGLLQNDGWLIPAFVSVDDHGKIFSISNSSEKRADIILNCFAIPGIQNSHSHAFQYAMAGLAESHTTSKTPDDFWSWRDAMYKLALSIDPDQMESIACMLYAEMLRHGYTNVAEFHYVHHDKNGQQFQNLSEMGLRLISAAKKVGIGITLVPIFYQKGGFGKDPMEGQKRFISNSIDSYYKLLDSSMRACQNYVNANCAIGIHSMRGVEPELIKEVALNGPQDLPFHIHVSEQLKEVQDSLDYLGKRPVEWMLENCNLNSRFQLVHATHLTESEISGIAKSGSHVVLCPSTEGNLGDGIFPLVEFQKAGGKWSIGTDSHIGLNPLEELRILDYGQRLTTHKRNSFYSLSEGDSGKFAIDMITKSGRKSMNNSCENYFAVGEFFNAMLVNADAPLLTITGEQNLCSSIVYATDSSMQRGVISHGKLFSTETNKELIKTLSTDFNRTLKTLANRI